jgi:phosphomannomutase
VEFSSAFAAYLPEPGPVVVGRDPRASGLMIREGVISCLLASGRDVVDLGLASTPVIQHAILQTGAAGGISIGASHNAAEWNALKFFGPGGRYLTDTEAGELLDFYHLRRNLFVPWNEIGTLREYPSALDAYLDGLAEAYDFPALARYRVVVDCCNGTSALALRRLNERFGFAFILVNERLEGAAFAHEPSTNARAVGLQLAPLVRPLQADAGFLFDVDADRVALSDEQGRALSEELVLPLLAEYCLPRSHARVIITNLSTSALIEEVAARHGGLVQRVPVGRQATAQALSHYRPEQVALAGEGTGAVMLPQFRFVYDGIASMFAVLSLMRDRGQPLSAIVDGFPRFCILKGEIPLESPRVPELLVSLRERYGSGPEAGVVDVSDGLRVSWPDRWFHVRVSQTEAVLRVICEQRDRPPTALFDALVEEAHGHV